VAVRSLLEIDVQQLRMEGLNIAWVAFIPIDVPHRIRHAIPMSLR